MANKINMKNYTINSIGILIFFSGVIILIVSMVNEIKKVEICDEYSTIEEIIPVGQRTSLLVYFRLSNGGMIDASDKNIEDYKIGDKICYKSHEESIR